MPVIDPTPEQLAALTQAPDDGPVAMVNLLAFKPDGGAAEYERYAEAVQPHLERVGARVLSAGAQRFQVIGEGDRTWWDATIVVEYPSIAAFVEMVSDPGYQEIGRHRTEALARAELIATKPGALTA